MALTLYTLLIGATFLTAGTVKGAIGLGLPTVAMGMLGVVMPPAQAAALLIIPSLVTNIWQLFSGPHWARLCRRLWPMLLAVCLGTWYGTGVMAGPMAGWTSLMLGILLMVYALVSLVNRQARVSAAAEKWLGPLAGLVTGLMTGATGVFVIPAVPWLNALALERDDLIQALGLSFTVSTLALAASLAWHDLLTFSALGLSLLAVIPALAGMFFGGYLRARLSHRVFRRCFFLGLLGLGMEITWQHLA
ncbi:sulfite exporter TauE/SafE family protein [Acerihabitans arboris]|uniref:Probable membrane transporter protein n=1 Tax=Acerihabitans arboris TaxID=2691583 RepID=A0A845SK68_9GAMM|nr:sulfite exporter TauE/SafE family protein [Acerihabitans arboris]NDL63782.1 TSUP family transporter [Acerihabitans arboris]